MKRSKPKHASRAVTDGPRGDPHSRDTVIELTLEDFAPAAGAVLPPLAPALQRRQFTRATYVTLCRVQPEDAPGSLVARIDDVSEAGMRLHVGIVAPVGTRIHVMLTLPITGSFASLRGVVRWASASGSRHVLGIEFETIPPEVRLVLVRYVSAMTLFET